MNGRHKPRIPQTALKIKKITYHINNIQKYVGKVFNEELP